MSAKTGLALSIQQPWAWLIASGHKDVENRPWATRIRGWVGIHAGKAFDREGYDFVRREFPQIPLPEAFDAGGIVGRVRITGCVQDLESPWFFGPYGFVLADAELLALRVCRGELGFFRPEFGASAD